MIGSLVHRLLVTQHVSRIMPDRLWSYLWLWALPDCRDCLRSSEFSHYV